MFMERIKYIDIAKGIGILLVIIGHSFPESYIQRICYCFHMPLFFFISGLCYNHLKYDFKKLLRVRTRQLLIPLVLFSVILYVLRFAVLQTTYFNSDLIFPDATWFLFVLFLSEMIGYFIIDKSPLIAILIGLTGVALFHIGIHLPNCLGSVPMATLYYCLGYKAKKHNLIYNKTIVWGGVIILLYSNFNKTYLDMKWSIFPFGSVILSLLGIIMTLTFCKYIKKQTKLIKVLIFFGKNTLVIMAVHLFFLTIAVDYIKPHLSGSLFEMIAYKVIQQIVMWIGVLSCIYVINNKARWMIGK